jgi:hypothetical protein
MVCPRVLIKKLSLSSMVLVSLRSVTYRLRTVPERTTRIIKTTQKLLPDVLSIARKMVAVTTSAT